MNRIQDVSTCVLVNVQRCDRQAARFTINDAQRAEIQPPHMQRRPGVERMCGSPATSGLSLNRAREAPSD